MEQIKQFDIWMADLNPTLGTEPGKTRLVVVVQTDFLNNNHPSTLVCPITSKVNLEITLLRVHLPFGQLNLPSDILVDHIRAIDNKRILTKLSQLTKVQIISMKRNLAIVLDLN